MIHIVTAANRRAYGAELAQHFRLRHDIYVAERGWKELARPDGLERDQFDNDDATYVLAVDDNRVIGGSRLIPTLKPHLLSEVFAGLAAVRGVPRGDDIVEWTRMFVVKERREGRNIGRTAGTVICGVLVRPPRVARSDGRAIVFPASNPVLIGARPGEIEICTPRSDVRVGLCVGFPWFEPIWAIPANALHCDKRTARVLLIGSPQPVAAGDGNRVGSHSRY